MEDAGMLIQLVEGNLPQGDDVFDDNDNLGEFPSEGGISNAVMSRSLPSASSSNMVASRMIAVSLEVGVTEISQFHMSGHLPDITSSLQPMVSSRLEQPGGILLDLTNNTTLDSNWTSVWSSEEVGAVIIISLMVPFILVSNIIVILCVIRFRRLHTPTNYFITSLAAVDIFVAVATPFVVVVEVFRFSDVAAAEDVVLCLLPNRILMMGCGVSVLTLAAIAYDRHTALVSPLKYVNIMTTRRVTVMVLLSWLYSVVIVWLPLMVGWYHVPSVISPCSANLIQGKAPLLFLSAIFVPSCVAIMICYFRILMVARQHVKAIAAFEFAVHRRVRVKCLMRETKCLKTLALIIGVFLVLWLPYLILIFLKTVSSMKFDVWLQTYLILLAVFNSGINPWMYAFMNSDLRKAFKRLFREICNDRFCASDRRRSSMVSAVSSTPRLSLTDSRAVSITPDPSIDVSIAVCVSPDHSLDLNTEALRQRLELCVEGQPLPAVCRLTHHDQAQFSEIAVQSLFVDWNQPENQAPSCPQLDTVDNYKAHKDNSLPRPRCTSFNHDVRERSDLDVLDDRDLITPGMYHQISVHIPRGQETPDGLNTATSSRVKAALSPSPPETGVLSIHPQSCTPLPQQAAQIITTLPPSSFPPGCEQTEHCTSLQTPVSCPTATAQIQHHPTSSPPSLCRHLHSTDWKLPSSPYTRLSDRPQTQGSSLSTQQDSPVTHPHDPCTCPVSHNLHSPAIRQTRDIFTNHRRPASTKSPQTSAESRTCPVPGLLTPQTSAHSRTCSFSASSPPQTSAHCRTCSFSASSPPLTSAHSRISSVAHLQPPQPDCSNCCLPSPPPPQPDCSNCCLPSPPPPQPDCSNCCLPSPPPPQPDCSNCSLPSPPPPQPDCSNCCLPSPPPPQPDCSNCCLPSPPPPQPDCSNCSLPSPPPPQPDCSNCSLPSPPPPQPDCSNCCLPSPPPPQPDCSNCSLPPPLRPPNRQFCAMFAPVTAYSFLLPLCETLALDVISTAARLETCIDLARLATCEHTMLIH